MISFERTVEYCLYHSQIESNKNEKNFFAFCLSFSALNTAKTPIQREKTAKNFENC